MINLGFQEPTYSTVTKTIPVIDIIVFVQTSYMTTIYYTNQMVEKMLQHWNFKNSDRHWIEMTLNQSDIDKIVLRGQNIVENEGNGRLFIVSWLFIFRVMNFSGKSEKFPRSTQDTISQGVSLFLFVQK